MLNHTVDSLEIQESWDVLAENTLPETNITKIAPARLRHPKRKV